MKEDLIDKFKELRPINISVPQVTVRCPYCGDSKKHSTSTHFGVLIDINNDDTPLYYNCFLCNESGVLTPTTLKDLDIYTLDLASGIIAYNKRLRSGTNSGAIYRRQKVQELKLPQYDTKYQPKVDYINQRLGLSLTLSDMNRLKIVPSLAQLVQYNNITQLTVGGRKALDLEENYVGFLTNDNDKIIFRAINSEAKHKRYEKYELNKNIRGQKFYSIPTVVELFGEHDIDIHIAEGALDILGVYYHIENQNDKNNVYIGASGNSATRIIRHLIELGFVGNVNYFIYRDADVPLGVYRKEMKGILEWVQHMFIVSNELEKDFGVPAERIKLTTMTLK